MKYIYILFMFIFSFSIKAAENDTIKDKKWEILGYFDPATTQIYNLAPSGQNQIDLYNGFGAGFDYIYYSNSKFLFSRKINKKMDILFGIGQFPRKQIFDNYYYVGTRFVKKRKYLELRYAPGLYLGYAKDNAFNQYGVKSTFSAAYVWKNLFVISLEHNMSFIYRQSKPDIVRDTWGLFVDDYPFLRLGIKL